jgi:hypothetical protein
MGTVSHLFHSPSRRARQPARIATPSAGTVSRLSRFGLLAAALAAGCGGKGGGGDTTPGLVSGTGNATSPRAEGAEGGEGGIVSPETMDEINRSLDRKRRIVSRCLAIAVDNKEVPRNASGKITLEIIISPNGKAESVTVVRATLDSKALNDCVIHHVRGIQFPELSKPYETSYTYGFEAM